MHRWEDNIKKSSKKTGYKEVDSIHLAQDRYQRFPLVNMAMNLQVP
jgi:hypothetical protein